MTCNSKWKELKEIFKKFPERTTPNDIPNITVRLFYAKFKMLLNDIIKHNIFGQVLSHLFLIEFQRRGLPHAHIIVTLHPNDKLVCPEAIDRYISAEILFSENLILQKLVIKRMLHGPHTDKCARKKYYSTIFKKDKYPKYKRRNNISDNHIYIISKVVTKLF